MRCGACNKILSDFEATRFDPVAKKYPDLCNSCIPQNIRERCRERSDLTETQFDDIVDGDIGDIADMFDDIADDPKQW